MMYCKGQKNQNGIISNLKLDKLIIAENSSKHAVSNCMIPSIVMTLCCSGLVDASFPSFGRSLVSKMNALTGMTC